MINLTNPLSLVTSLMTAHGISRCLGLCELPEVTAATAIDELGMSLSSTNWSYARLNHRGFVINLQDNQTTNIPWFEKLNDAPPKLTIAGFSPTVLLYLKAIPTKYFHLVQGTGAPAAGRAALLSTLRNTLLDELEQTPDRTPASLHKRNTDWYRISVVPVLKALSGSGEARHVINQTDSDSITRESMAMVSCDQIETLDRPAVPSEAQKWIQRYESHEQSQLELIKIPCVGAIKHTAELDLWSRLQVHKK